MACLAISLGTGVIGGIVTAKGMEHYETLYKPPLTPPAAVFPVVWTILFLLIGIASYLVLVSDSPDKKGAGYVYLLQLLVNLGWSVFFFGFQAYWLSFFWLLFLWILIFETIRRFYEIRPLAGRLLYPYIAWVTFAGYLNFAIALNG